MNSSDSRSTRDKGRKNAERLAEWLESTPLSSIPLNQYGVASRSNICKSLGITLSTVGSNKSIQQMFAELDAKLGGTPSQRQEYPERGLVSSLQQKIGRLENRLVAVQLENAQLRQKIRALEHLELTGRLVR